MSEMKKKFQKVSTHLFINYRGAKELLGENINLVEEIGLNLKAVVCDRPAANRKTLRGFKNGVYIKKKEKKEDGIKYAKYMITST